MAAVIDRRTTPAEFEAMTDAETKVFEARLRRMAKRQGLILQKSRERDPRSTTYGTYWLINARSGNVEAHGSGSGFGMNLLDIEKTLLEDGE